MAVPQEVAAALSLAGSLRRGREGARVHKARQDGWRSFHLRAYPILRQAPLESTTPLEIISQKELKKLPGQSARCVGSRSNRPSLKSDRPATGVLLTSQKRPFLAESPNVSDWQSPPLRIHIPDDFLHATSLFPLSAGRSQKFVQANAVEDAAITVRSEGEDIVIGFMKSHRENRIALPENRVRLPEAIESVACFNYFLDCSNEADRIGPLELEMYQLKGEYPTSKPGPQNRNLIHDSKVQVESEKGVKYGFRIRNASSEDLFPHLLYFDPESGESNYHPPLRQWCLIVVIQQWYSPERRAPIARRDGDAWDGYRLRVRLWAVFWRAVKLRVPQAVCHG
ncbi:hypothetical protein C8R45DRAFT_1187984 [Mycena sanguinolenta]|nr:hypothetical protein C8R45DRAFT_1187984 [Mycena sanguinolenta]